MINCANLAIELIIIIPCISYINDIGTTIASAAVRINAFIGISLLLRFPRKAGRIPSLAIASHTLGAWKDEATLIPNIEIKAPIMIIPLIILFPNTAARITTSSDCTRATGFIIIATSTMPK